MENQHNGLHVPCFRSQFPCLVPQTPSRHMNMLHQLLLRITDTSQSGCAWVCGCILTGLLINKQQ